MRRGEVALRDGEYIPAQRQAYVQSLSQSATITAAGNTGTFTYNVPAGYSRLTGIYFDPANDISIILKSQKAQTNILEGFSTSIGTALGFLPLKLRAIENDVLTLRYTVNAAPAFPRLLTFTLMFE